VKFNDGYWLLRPGVEVLYPRHLHAWEHTADSITAVALTIPYRDRGSVLNAPTIQVRLEAPAPDVVRVTITHHLGERSRGPRFELTEAPGSGVATRQDGWAVLTSGRLTARLRVDGDWALEFRGDDRLLTSSGVKSMGYALVDDAPFVLERLGLGVGESIYGLGERFTPFVKNGQAVENWNADGGTSSEQAYKSVPFYLSSRGYGVFVESPGRVSYEVGSEVVSRVQFSVPGESLTYDVVYGGSLAGTVSRYSDLTGRPALPPLWSFGVWLSTSFTTDYDETSVMALIDGMAERGLPLSVFHFDTFWMRSLQWSDFEWDPAVFPDPAGMLARLHARGIRTSVWINPYIGQRSPLFEEARRAGYLLMRPNGDVWQSDLWVAGMGIVDFTDPAARRWYTDKLRALLRSGVDTLKTDFGERIPAADVVWSDGSDPERMHNYYSLLYNRTVFEAIREERGEGEAVVFARSGTAGSQQFPVHWGGDSEPTFASMAETLRGGLSLSASGFAFWSHDIGGFERSPDPEVYKRWIPFGLLSTHSRLHGSDAYRVPWLVDAEAVDVLRTFTRLKMRMMPYLWWIAVEAHRTGVPVLRPMVMEFPHDPATAGLDRQYMLGPDILVAPVFDADGTVEYYVPGGTWTHLLSGETVAGPRWVREQHDVTSLPVLVRPGAVLPWGAVDDRPDYDHAAGVELRAFGVLDGDEVEVSVADRAGAPAARWRVRGRAGGPEAELVAGASSAWSVMSA
jgi:alpha-D-xyloside xylohydrolase